MGDGDTFDVDFPFRNKLCMPYYLWTVPYITGALVNIYIHKFVKGPLEKVYKEGSSDGSDGKQILYRCLLFGWYALRIVMIMFTFVLVWERYDAWHQTHINKSDWNAYLGYCLCVLYLPSMKCSSIWLTANMYIHKTTFDMRGDLEVVEDDFVKSALIANVVLDCASIFLVVASIFPVFVSGFYIFVPLSFAILFGTAIAWKVMQWTLTCFFVIVGPLGLPTPGEPDQHQSDTYDITAGLYLFLAFFQTCCVAFMNFQSGVGWDKSFNKTLMGEYCDEYYGNYDYYNWKMIVIAVTWLFF